MKTLIAFAATLALAAPALAQTTPSQSSAPAPATAPGTGTGDVDAAAARAARMGGYQPDRPAMSGPVAPGQQVIFQAAPPPDVAYPAPPPLQHYPVCKKGQFDGCIQRGGK